MRAKYFVGENVFGLLNGRPIKGTIQSCKMLGNSFYYYLKGSPELQGLHFSGDEICRDINSLLNKVWENVHGQTIRQADNRNTTST
jgi:hypothetical protein